MTRTNAETLKHPDPLHFRSGTHTPRITCWRRIRVVFHVHPNSSFSPENQREPAQDWPNKEKSQNEVGNLSSYFQPFVDIYLTPTVLQWSSPHELLYANPRRTDLLWSPPMRREREWESHYLFCYILKSFRQSLSGHSVCLRESELQREPTETFLKMAFPSSPTSSTTSSSYSSSFPNFNVSSLPVMSLRKKIVDKIMENRVTLIVGETGCGTLPYSTPLCFCAFFFFHVLSVAMSLYSVMYYCRCLDSEKTAEKSKDIVRENVTFAKFCMRFRILYYLLLSKDSMWAKVYSTYSYTSTFTNYHHHCAKVFYID